MQSIWQKHIDASISSTVNLPESATIEDVRQLYIYAWRNKLKGLTIFRENCARVGVLTSEKKEEPKVTQGKLCWVEKETPTKFHSYRPVVSSLQYDYFVNGFFNATEEEKIKFGLIFNDLDAYTICCDAFNEAEEFYASHSL